MFLADQLLESAVTDASRLIRTGQASAASYSAADFKSKVCAKLYMLFDCSQLYVNVQTPATFSAANLAPPAIDPNTGKFTTAQNYSNGSSATIVVVSVYYLFPVLGSNFGLSLADQGNGTRLLGAVSAFRSEPY